MPQATNAMQCAVLKINNWFFLRREILEVLNQRTHYENFYPTFSTYRIFFSACHIIRQRSKTNTAANKKMCHYGRAEQARSK